MAMLAEARRKQKWMLNPRGKDWSNDTNKFGQRMLEKMGWTSGKGLGINEQGATDHVRVKVKNDTVGIGFKNEEDKAWTEHQKAFDDFLSSLNENADSNTIKKINAENSGTITQSLELKSKQSRARVHYQKFTRGKDVKKYSAKDLADILGGRDILNKENQIEEPQEKNTNAGHDVENIPESTVTINKGSITDYFKKKTSQFLKDKDNSNTNSVNGSDDEVEQYRGFGFLSKSPNKKKSNKSKLECNYTFDNPALDLHNSNDTVLQENTKCLNKRKGDTSIENDMQNLDYEENCAKKIKIDDNDKNCKEGFINMALDLDTDNNESHVTNKFEVSRTNLGLTNDALDLTDEIKEKKRVTFNNHVEYSTDSNKKKKHTGTLDKFEIDSKKRKKKQKQLVNTDVSNKIGIINEALDINLMSEELKDNKVNESKSKKNKKLIKQQRMSNLETIEETSEEAGTNNGREVENMDNNVDPNLISEENAFEEKNIEIKKKKKKSKNKKHETEIDETISHISENINSSKKKEKVKKKDKHIVLDDDITCEKVTEKTSHKKESKETHRNEEDITNVPLDEIKEIFVVEEKNVVEDELKKKLKHQRKNDKKHINVIDLECKLDQNIDDLRINEEVKVKAESKHNINGKESNTLSDTKDDETINISNSEMQLQNRKLPKIKHEENMKNRFFIESSKKYKKIIRSHYNLNDIVNFPGSNLNKIKDYGEDLIQ
ncbi:PREDICTED: G patch domain-containing protein 4-like [Polistes canadensis]|uniref:G patch domain-containing protein 4-like n=1 Tax=Polistes canadensis TaxID=91411 RepID=UPI000718B430|nr:PREDICTED: G patch domain-containing protein 4-like [Polistes canadensis]